MIAEASAATSSMPLVPGLPVFGSIVPIARLGMMEFMRRAWREYGDTFRISLGGTL